MVWGWRLTEDDRQEQRQRNVSFCLCSFFFKAFVVYWQGWSHALRIYNSLHPLGQDKNLCEKPESFQAFAGRKRAYCKIGLV